VIYSEIFFIFVSMYLIKEANAWVKRKVGPDEVIRIVPDAGGEKVVIYNLYIAYGSSDYLGRILFDQQGYWIYDGDIFSVVEQEQLAKFIINHEEMI